MRKTRTAWGRAVGLLVATVALALSAAAPAFAQAPWDGEPISQGLGPTYGEPWCAPTEGESVHTLQGPPLALMPYAAIQCSLEQFKAEAVAAGIPQRMSYEVIGKTHLGRDVYGVVVNALETPAQQRDFERWQQLRQLQLDDPAAAQALVASWGGDVKMPIFIQANIHGGEREGLDASMQIIRDLMTTPRGAHPLVDQMLDDSIFVVIPSENPDGRVAGTRQNEHRFDMNRDWLVQSQPEVQASVRYQQRWLAPVALDLHGYYNPTLIDGLTKPHNPGLEYDIFLGWNQRRLDQNEARISAMPGDPGTTGFRIQRPVNQWDERGISGVTTGNPAIAEGWDDWGPFYTQTYMALLGIDSSTPEMCNSTSPTAGCGGQGRLGSKKVQYLTVYSSAEYWLANKQQAMFDQLEIFRRGVTDAARPNCCDDPLIASRGFTEADHHWMVEYPRAFVIPRDGGGQRSDAEANRLVQWLLNNGIKVNRANSSFTWDGQTYPAGSYVVFMNQALRGLAYTGLGLGQDISDRITQLYAPPGAWSHGYLWGADLVEVPRGPAFNPATTQITEPAPLEGGVRGGVGAPADFYSVTLRGPNEARVVLGLLRSGVSASLAEVPFASTTGGPMPAGTLIFRGGMDTVAALDAAGRQAGIWFERNVGVARPQASRVARAPRIAVLVNSTSPETSTVTRPILEVLRAIFGDAEDVGFVSTVSGAGSLQNAPDDPLRGYDVIYNTGVAYPAEAEATARERLNAFFARGGGYIGTGQSANNFAFITQSGVVTGDFTQTSQSAYGGIAVWNNVGGSGSPITGGYPARDTIYIPSNVTYFSSLPGGAVVDGRYVENTNDMFLAGLWRDRSPDVPNSPMIARGATNVGSRYMGVSTDPLSRHDHERAWTLVVQAALWTALTDEASSSVGFPTQGAAYNEARWNAGCAGAATICGTASGAPGPAIAQVQVAVQQVSTGLWWNGTAFASATPVYENASGTATWSYTFPGSRLSDGEYVVRSKAIDAGGNEEVSPDSVRFTYDTTPPAVDVRSPVAGATYVRGQHVIADYRCADAVSGVGSCAGPVPAGSPINTRAPGQHQFTVAATDRAGNQTFETVTYNVALLSCTVTVSGRPVATRSTQLTLRVRAQAPDRAVAQPARPLRVTLRGAGVNRAVAANANGVARVAVRPRAAGTIRVVATSPNMAACRATLRVRPAPRPAAATAALTGRPKGN